MKKYRPSNGTEGMRFQSVFCDRCAGNRFDADPNRDHPCKVLGKSLCYETDSPNYPKEWVCEDDGSKPRCTAFLDVSYREKLEEAEELERLDKAEREWREIQKGGQ